METKKWLTPARIARGPEAARAELARWGQENDEDIEQALLQGAPEFQSGKWRNRRAYENILKRRKLVRVEHASDLGAPSVIKAPAFVGRFSIADLLSLGVAIGGGVLVGLWWRKHRRRAVGGTLHVLGAQSFDVRARNPYFQGTLILAAC